MKSKRQTKTVVKRFRTALTPLKNLTALLLLIGIVMVGCKKEEAKVVKVKKDNGQIVSGISFSDIENTCSKHNQYLDEIFAGFNFEATNYIEELQRCIQNSSLDNLSAEAKDSVIQMLSDESILYTFDDLLYMIDTSTLLNDKSSIISLLSAIDSNSFNVDYEDISDMVDSLECLAYYNLNDYDLLFTLSYFEMVRYSSYYWMPAENGGNGYGNEILCYGISQNDTSQTNQRVKDVADVLITDCTSIAIGMVRVAFFSPTVVGLAIVATKAAVRSAAKAISISMKNR